MCGRCMCHCVWCGRCVYIYGVVDLYVLHSLIIGLLKLHLDIINCHDSMFMTAVKE